MSGTITISSHSDIDYRVVYALCMLLGALGAFLKFEAGRDMLSQQDVVRCGMA